MLSKPASRKVEKARRTSSGDAPRSSTSSRRGSKLCAPSDTRVTPLRRSSAASSGVTVSGFASTVTSARVRQRAEQPLERRRTQERGRAAAEKHRLDVVREHVALELQLAEQRLDVAAVLAVAADDGDEVAVAAAVRAERNVHVQMPHVPAHRVESPRLRTARNASCGTSTAPTCFIRFLPAFCFSSSFRLRVMSPP